jgi:hypothetical protein
MTPSFTGTGALVFHRLSERATRISLSTLAGAGTAPLCSTRARAARAGPPRKLDYRVTNCASQLLWNRWTRLSLLLARTKWRQLAQNTWRCAARATGAAAAQRSCSCCSRSCRHCVRLVLNGYRVGFHMQVSGLPVACPQPRNTAHAMLRAATAMMHAVSEVEDVSMPRPPPLFSDRRDLRRPPRPPSCRCNCRLAWTVVSSSRQFWAGAYSRGGNCSETL